MPITASPAPGPSPSRLHLLLPVALLIVYLAQCVWFLRTQSLTYDEPVHIAEGLEAWRHGKFEQYNDHPSLVRLLCTLPLIDQKWQIDVEQFSDHFRASRIAPDPIRLTWRARAVNVVLGLVLAGLVWWTTRRAFSIGAANFALALFVFSPPLIAHFCLVTTDGAATLLIFATALMVAWWRDSPSRAMTLLLGAVLGLLLLAKFSTPVMFVLAVAWMFVPGRHIASLWLGRIGGMALAVAVALLVVWAGYFFHTSRLTLGADRMVVTYPHRSDMIYKIHSPVHLSVLIPAGEYIEGFRNTVRHNARGQPAFFLGKTSRSGGWKSYFPVVTLLKWPTLVLVLLLISAWLLVRGRLRVPGWLWVMASFPALYFATSLFAHFDLGDRHILPVYPFVILFAAGTWEGLHRRQSFVVGLVVLVLLQAADGLRCAPDYLSYINILVRPSESYRLLSDSNLDWGQGLLALREYQEAHPADPLALAYFGSVDPAVYGIRYRPLAEGERTQGLVVVSATNLSGQYLQSPSGYRWLLQYPRVAILNHSLFVFRVPGDGTTGKPPAEPGVGR